MSTVSTPPSGIILLTPRGPVELHRPGRAVDAEDRDSSVAGLWVTVATVGLPAVILGIVVARYGTSALWVRALGAFTLLVTVATVLKDLRYGLALFILAAGLSPKLPGFYNNLRVEDFVFALVFGVWLLKALQRGRIPLVHSPIVRPFLLLTLMSALSTVWGCYLGAIPEMNYSLFLQLKRIEYFLIFWVAATTIRSEPWVRALTLLFVVSGALAALYGIAHADHDGYVTVADRRVIGPEGENYNTLSGYLVVCIGVGLGVMPAFRGAHRLLLIACTALAGLGLLLSFSREGYIMLVGSLLVFGFTRHRVILLGAAIALAAAFLTVEPVRKNIDDTVQKIRVSRHDDPGGNSLSARYQTWRGRWNDRFLQQPIIGKGVGCVDLSIDSEYLLRACEVGVVGFALFLWWLGSIGGQIRNLRARGGLQELLATGLLAGFVGLLIQGLVAASFNTIRTMEPFWFLLGLVSAASLIQGTGRLSIPLVTPQAADRLR